MPSFKYVKKKKTEIIFYSCTTRNMWNENPLNYRGNRCRRSSHMFLHYFLGFLPVRKKIRVLKIFARIIWHNSSEDDRVLFNRGLGPGIVVVVVLRHCSVDTTADIRRKKQKNHSDLRYLIVIRAHNPFCVFFFFFTHSHDKTKNYVSGFLPVDSARLSSHFLYLRFSISQLNTGIHYSRRRDSWIAFSHGVPRTNINRFKRFAVVYYFFYYFVCLLLSNAVRTNCRFFFFHFPMSSSNG